MKEIRVHYEHWMNVHSDDWPVRIAWGFLEMRWKIYRKENVLR